MWDAVEGKVKNSLSRVGVTDDFAGDFADD
jgi:hypothetical protein